MFIARANPTFSAMRTRTQSGSADETRVQFGSVAPFSTTTIRCFVMPSETSDSTQRIVRSGMFQSTTTAVNVPSDITGGEGSLSACHLSPRPGGRWAARVRRGGDPHRDPRGGENVNGGHVIPGHT